MRVDPAKLALSVDFLNFLPLIPRIGVAVSGGSDSMALLHLVALAGREAGIAVHAATVDHGLRPEAAKEAVFVADVCARLGVTHDSVEWTGWDGKGNLQAEARDARYRLLGDWAAGRDIAQVTLGHTADDLAETMIMRLGRGAGVDGLTGIAGQFSKHGVQFLRPLLQMRRAHLRLHLEDLGQTWCDDPSNDDTHYDRIRIRKAMQTLEDVGLTPDALGLVAQNMQSAKMALNLDMARQAKVCVTQQGGDLLIDDRAFVSLNLEQSRRMLSAVIRWISGQVYVPRREAQIKVLHAVRHRKHASVSGCLIVPEKDRVRVFRELNAVANSRSGTTDFWDGRWQMSGPHIDGLEVRALGESGILNCPNWRNSGMPRASLMASPAIWQGETLISAPMAGNSDGWEAHIVTDFHEWLVSH